MLSKLIAAVLIGALTQGNLAAQTQPSPVQTVAKMQQVLHKAQEKDRAVKVTLKKKMDGQGKFTGKVSEISDTGFTIADQKTGKAVKLDYDGVKEVRLKGTSGALIAALAIAGGVVVIAVVLVASQIS